MSNHATNHASGCARTQSRNHETTQKACKDAITQAITAITPRSITQPCVTTEHTVRVIARGEEGEGHA
jgi:hypothetical protein